MAERRAEKKRQRRQAILDSARALFSAKGYDATTIEEITNGAGCSPRTFFQYFGSKEDLLLEGMGDLWKSLKERLAKRSPRRSALETAADWKVTMTREHRAGARALLDVTDGEKDSTRLALEARVELLSLRRFEEVLIPELARDLLVPSDALELRIIARAAAAVLSADADPVLAGSDPFVFKDAALLMLEGGVKAIYAGTAGRRSEVRKRASGGSKKAPGRKQAATPKGASRATANRGSSASKLKRE